MQTVVRFVLFCLPFFRDVTCFCLCFSSLSSSECLFIFILLSIWNECSDYLMNLQMKVLGLLKFVKNYWTFKRARFWKPEVRDPLEFTSPRWSLLSSHQGLPGKLPDRRLHLCVTQSRSGPGSRKRRRFIRIIQENLQLNHKFIKFICLQP